DRIDRAFMPVVLLQELAELAPRLGVWPRSLREVITAGEALRITPAIRALFRRLDPCRLVNQYGPTEAHVVSAYPLEGPPESWPERPPIGRPIDNVRLLVVDRAGRPNPVGVPGELLIGGECLARGYLHRPDLTSARFLDDLPDLDCGGRWYRS